MKDNCEYKNNTDWLVHSEANMTDSELIINLGCMKLVKGLKIKNVKKEIGGTKEFKVFLSDSHSGPWKEILSDTIPEQELLGCAPFTHYDLE